MTTDPNLEAAARRFVEKTGGDPDKKISERVRTRIDKIDADGAVQLTDTRAPVYMWEEVADQLRRHALFNEVLEWANAPHEGVVRVSPHVDAVTPSHGWRPISEAPITHNLEKPMTVELADPEGSRAFGHFANGRDGEVIFMADAFNVTDHRSREQLAEWRFKWRHPTPLPEGE